MDKNLIEKELLDTDSNEQKTEVVEVGGSEANITSEESSDSDREYDMTELMELIKSYKKYRSDIYGKRKPVTKKEKQKKKAKRRMVKKSRK